MIVVGLDWGRVSHCYAVLDASGRLLTEGKVANQILDLEAWVRSVEPFQDADQVVRLAVESGNGLSIPVEEICKARGWHVVAVGADAVKAYRTAVLRKNNKTDTLDALAIAHLGAAADSHGSDARSRPQRRKLRRATRDRDQLSKEKTRITNRLRELIAEFWPDATTERFPALDTAALLHLFEHHSDPQTWAKMGVNGVSTLLVGARVRTRSEHIEKLVALAELYRPVLSSDEMKVILAEVRGATRRLRHCNEELVDAERLIALLCQGDKAVEIVDEIPGAGLVLASAIVAEIQDINNFPSEAHLASYAGLALKRHQTGKSSDYQTPQLRSNRRLKHYMLLLAMSNATRSPVSKRYHDKKILSKKPLQARRAVARQLVRVIYRSLKRSQPPGCEKPL